MKFNNSHKAIFSLASFVVLTIFFFYVDDGKTDDSRLHNYEENKADDLYSYVKDKKSNVVAYISCEFSGTKMHPMLCFEGTNIKISDKNGVRMFTQHNVNSAGIVVGNQLQVPLSGEFKISAQNGSTDFHLRLKIFQGSEVIYEDMAGAYRTLRYSM